MKSVIKTAKTVDEAINAGLAELSILREDAQIEILEEGSRGIFGLIGGKDAVVRISTEDSVKKEILRDLRMPLSEEKTQKEDKEIQKVSKAVKEDKKEESVKKIEIKEESSEKVEEISDDKDSKVKPFVEKKDEPIAEEPPVKENIKQEKEVEAKTEEEIKILDIEDIPSVDLLKAIFKQLDMDPTIEAKQINQILYLNAIDVPDDRAGLVIGRRGETLDAIQYLLTLSSHKRNVTYRKVILDVNDYRKDKDEELRQMAKRSGEKVLENKRNMRLKPMNSYERRIVHAELQKLEGIHTISEGSDPYRRVVIRINRREDK